MPTRGGSSRNCDCCTRAWSELGVVIIGYGQVKLSYGGLKRGTRESVGSKFALVNECGGVNLHCNLMHKTVGT